MGIVADMVPTSPPHRDDTHTCPWCHQLFVRRGRARYCTPACRQAAWRQRHKHDQIITSPTRRDAQQVFTMRLARLGQDSYLLEHSIKHSPSLRANLAPDRYVLGALELAAIAETVMDTAIAAARVEGATWTHIAGLLHVSEKAARRRYQHPRRLKTTLAHIWFCDCNSCKDSYLS